MLAKQISKILSILAALVTVVVLSAAFSTPAAALIPGANPLSSFDFPFGEWGRFTIFNSLEAENLAQTTGFGNPSLATYLYYGNIEYYSRLNATNNAYSDFYSRLNATNNAEAANLVATTGIENPSLAAYLYYGNFSYYSKLP